MLIIMYIGYEPTINLQSHLQNKVFIGNTPTYF